MKFRDFFERVEQLRTIFVIIWCYTAGLKEFVYIKTLLSGEFQVIQLYDVEEILEQLLEEEHELWDNSMWNNEQVDNLSFQFFKNIQKAQHNITLTHNHSLSIFRENVFTGFDHYLNIKTFPKTLNSNTAFLRNRFFAIIQIIIQFNFLLFDKVNICQKNLISITLISYWINKNLQ